MPPKVVHNTLLCNTDPRVTSAVCIGQAPSLTIGAAVSSEPLKLIDHDTKLVATGEFPPLNTADKNICDPLPDKTIPAGVSVLKPDKELFSKENGKKFFASEPVKSKVPRKASDQDISQVAAVTASSEAEVPGRKDCQELSSQLPTKAVSLVETPLSEPTNKVMPSTSSGKPGTSSKDSAPPLDNCRYSTVLQRFTEAMFAAPVDQTAAPTPRNPYNSIVVSLTASTLVAIAEIIRIAI